jgi:hypothetical protein
LLPYKQGLQEEDRRRRELGSPRIKGVRCKDKQEDREVEDRESLKMQDWAPVFISVVLFILLSPGLLFQIPGKCRIIEFGNFHTSALSILVHAILYFALVAIFLIAIGIHMYLGS